MKETVALLTYQMVGRVVRESLCWRGVVWAKDSGEQELWQGVNEAKTNSSRSGRKSSRRGEGSGRAMDFNQEGAIGAEACAPASLSLGGQDGRIADTLRQARTDLGAGDQWLAIGISKLNRRADFTGGVSPLRPAGPTKLNGRALPIVV